jgi:hypothetical protein
MIPPNDPLAVTDDDGSIEALLRLFIIGAFVVATIWVFVPLMNAGRPKLPAECSDPLDMRAQTFFECRAVRQELAIMGPARTLEHEDMRKEAVVVVIAGVAWVLAGLLGRSTRGKANPG